MTFMTYIADVYNIIQPTIYDLGVSENGAYHPKWHFCQNGNDESVDGGRGGLFWAIPKKAWGVLMKPYETQHHHRTTWLEMTTPNGQVTFAYMSTYSTYSMSRPQQWGDAREAKSDDNSNQCQDTPKLGHEPDFKDTLKHIKVDS